MKERLIDVYEMLLEDNYVITTIVKKCNKYVIERCIVNDYSIQLIYKVEFEIYEKAYRKFEEIKTTI